MADNDFEQLGTFKDEPSEQDDKFSNLGKYKSSQPLWSRIASDIDIGGAEFGYGMAGAPHYIAQSLAKHGVIPPQVASKIPAPTTPDFGKTWGVPKPNIGDVALQGISRYLPYAAAGGATLPGQVAAGGAYGLTQSKEPFIGALKGALTNLALGGAGKAIGGAGKALRGEKPAMDIGELGQTPDDQAKNIVNSLTGGATPSENAQLFASQVKDKALMEKMFGSKKFNDVLDSPGVGGQPIRNNNVYQGDLKQNYPEELQSINKSRKGKALDEFYNFNLRDLHNTFMENPTVDNAHTLQSNLGTEIRSLEKIKNKGMLTRTSDQNKLIALKRLKNSSSKDINNFLSTQDKTGALSAGYNEAINNWAKNAAPYTENPKIAQIASGAKQNPGNISTLFKSPEPETEKIVNDMGDEAKHRILADDLTRTPITAKKLIASPEKLENSRLDMYKTPSFDNKIKGLSDSMEKYEGKQTKTQQMLEQEAKKRAAISRTAGAISGLALSLPFKHLMPFGIPEAIGAGVGAYAAPTIGKGVGAIASPTAKILSNRLAKALAVPTTQKLTSNNTGGK